eukprot:SAG31_NODE_234_length_19701_cov_16.835068_9_plen_52_part_00
MQDLYSLKDGMLEKRRSTKRLLAPRQSPPQSGLLVCKVDVDLLARLWVGHY